MLPKKPPAKSGIDAIRHNEKRKNIPPGELLDNVVGDEHNPSILRYPRDPSLDPQSVWKGGDEQDGKDLKVPAVPIYIQENIHPKVIIEKFLESQRTSDRVKEALKEAVQGLGYDLLLVCGFAFDSYVSEELKRNGNLMVLPIMMNPDLAMGDELLKKTGRGNLFMLFGEPDINIVKEKRFIAVKLKGVDVYVPTTRQVRSYSTDDVACWFINTDYNGESFFVRHAYFTGADKP
ncbi:MAG TPA: hypothetical protein PLA23_13620, partial [Methanospirillum sp.]